MNLILVEPEEVSPEGVCLLRDARAAHLRQFLHAQPGATFQVGIVNGEIGTGTVRTVSPDAVSFSLNCTTPSLPPWFDLVLALTRPRSLRRILFQSATLGVRTLYLTGAQKVEKSYFSMHLLQEPEYRPVLLEGLMQGKTTRLPAVRIIPRLSELWACLPTDATRFIANPTPTDDLSSPLPLGFPLIAVGPDGGWTPEENTAFLERGFLPVSLGSRPLRTDTAAIALPAVIRARQR